MRTLAYAVALALWLGAAAAHAQDPSGDRPTMADAVAELAADATDLTCLFGMPTESQRQAATHATAAAIGSAPPRDARGRLIHARGLLIAASVRDAGPERDTLIERALAIAEAASPGEPDLQTERFVLLAIGEIFPVGAGGDAAARAFDHLVDAKSVMRANRSALPRAAALQLQVTCATVLAALAERGPDAALRTIHRVTGEPPFTNDGRPDVLARLLLADLSARAHAAGGAWADVCAAYQSVADQADWGLAPDVRRTLALEKLRAALPRDVRLDGLPPIAALALAPDLPRAEAIGALRRAGARAGPWCDDIAFALGRLLAAGGGDEQREAAGVLLVMAQRSPGHARASEAIAIACAAADACGDNGLLLQALGEAHQAGEDVPGIGVLRLRLAQELTARGEWDRATAVLDAIDAAGPPGSQITHCRVAIARARYRRSGSTGHAQELVDLCESVRQQGEPRAPAWCEAGLAQGRLALGQADLAIEAALRAIEAADEAPGEAAAAQAKFDAVGVLVDALLERGRYADAGEQLERLALLDEAGQGASAAAEVERSAWAVVEPLAGPLLADRVGAIASRDPVERLRVVLGWAEVHADDAVARGVAYRLGCAEVLAGDAASAADRMSEARSVMGAMLRAEAQLATGDDAAAFATLSRLAQSLRADAHPAAHWQSWTRILQILDRQNVDGSRSPTIRRRLVTLGPPDEASCGACVGKIEALRAKYLDDAGRE